MGENPEGCPSVSFFQEIFRVHPEKVCDILKIREQIKKTIYRS